MKECRGDCWNDSLMSDLAGCSQSRSNTKQIPLLTVKDTILRLPKLLASPEATAPKGTPSLRTMTSHSGRSVSVKLTCTPTLVPPAPLCTPPEAPSRSPWHPLCCTTRPRQRGRRSRSEPDTRQRAATQLPPGA